VRCGVVLSYELRCQVLQFGCIIKSLQTNARSINVPATLQASSRYERHAKLLISEYLHFSLKEGNIMAEIPEDDPRTALAGERTNLAKFRVSLALDRTTLAWIRTALTFATFGFGMIGFFRALRQASQSEESVRLHQAAIHMGVALVVLGLVATTLAALSHWVALRRLRRGEQAFITQWPLSITIAIFVAVLGLYALWSLLVP
jgi:putative membrane protein